jgi:hypothetical protein
VGSFRLSSLSTQAKHFLDLSGTGEVGGEGASAETGLQELAMISFSTCKCRTLRSFSEGQLPLHFRQYLSRISQEEEQTQNLFPLFLP